MHDLNGPLARAILELSMRIGRMVSPLADFETILKENHRAGDHTTTTDRGQASHKGHAEVQGDPKDTQATG